MAEFKVIETQEQLDEVIKDRIERAKESAKKEFTGWLSPEDVTKKQTELESKFTKLENDLKEAKEKSTGFETQITEKDRKIKAYEIDSVKTKVANEMGLSFDAVSFLKGEDEKSIKESAETLKKLVGGKKAPLNDPEPDPEDKKNAAYKELLQGLNG